MARVTIEDCLKTVDNMYELVHIATKRARQLYKGSNALVKSKNRVVVTSLREIAANKVRAQYGAANSENDMPPVAN
ncbi:MAG: DNA-directed RNA polymerase subunit omega [Cryobacterium sp.]|nr:DNA-directed RNA polymerase subunit omega [Oligoflexia bacterium]